jgi:hypothetical protein
MSKYNLKIGLIQEPELLKHKDKDFFICSGRHKPIQAKPEEILRQKIVTYLTDILGYPLNCIGIEVPMTRFLPRKKGRADIIIYDRKLTRTDAKPLILIECKANDHKKTLGYFQNHVQLQRYNKVVNAKIIMLTNGEESFISEVKTKKQLERLPAASEIRKKKGLKYIETDQYSWERTLPERRFDRKTQARFIKKDLISNRTDKNLFPYIIQLMDLFYDDKTVFKSKSLGDFESIRDKGLREANYGYAYSSGLNGNYRLFQLRQKDGNHTFISYSVYHQNAWGTYLMIAVDDRTGHSLELQLDKYLKPSKSNSSYDIWHNGSLTAGKKGRLKNSTVIEYLKINAPFLVENDKVILGTLDLAKQLTFEMEEVRDFILRTAVYAILREEIRQEHQMGQ